MLQLRLREEFRGRRLKGTAIELTNSSNTGATQVGAKEFLEITYPSADAQVAIKAVGSAHGRPLVFIGERGQGKSHLMAMLHYGFTDPEATRSWLSTWAGRLGDKSLTELPLRGGMHVISESLHRQNYRFLWDLVFERHPYGPEVRGMWKGGGAMHTDVPSYDLLLKLFTHTPTALILDEFQTWYDGLTNTKQFPWRNWAFNFVQLLSEIAKEHPDRLVLVVSLRNGNTDAFQQIQRVGPILADFKGPTAKLDRQKLLLHRLFENRMQVPAATIERVVGPHVSESLRLRQIPSSEHDHVRQEFIQCWPFSPHLMQLLEDQVLVATQAQETRDLIRVLADLFKRHEGSPVVTAAHFRLDDKKSGVTALLDSVSNPHHAKLRASVDRPASLGRSAALLRPSRARRQPRDGELLRPLQGGEPIPDPRRRIARGTQRHRPGSDRILQSGAPSLLSRRPAAPGYHHGPLPRGLSSTTNPEVRCPTFGGHFIQSSPHATP